MTQARDTSDQEAFARVVEDCHHLLRATMLRETADPELADELAQDAFSRAWQKRDQYRTGTSPRAWLLAIARSQLMEFHRRADRDRRHMRDLVRQELLRHQPRDNAGHAERLDALRTCLSEFGDDHRHMLELVHGQGLSTEDAATTLGIRADACRQRISRLQRKLRECTEKRLGIVPTPADES